MGSLPMSRRRSWESPACQPGRPSPVARCWCPRRADRAHVVASAAVRTEDQRLVNPILALGQIIVSIALIAAILLQARGTGLSGTFGGDSAVYRSRRGVERRLWQFTIVLLILFVAFSLASYILAPSTTA